MVSSLSEASTKGYKDDRLPYQYRNLDRPGKEIRVLEVLPGSKNQPLRAKFTSEFLLGHQTNPYETISYAWGDSTQRGEILIDDSVIDIPASSDAALRCMRWRDKSRRLWIDAVCINQDEILERNFQVKIMGEIYSRSSHNLIYLGEEDPSTKSAMASIGSALEELNKKRLRDVYMYGFRAQPLTKMIKHHWSPLQCELDLAAMSHFFKRPWFRELQLLVDPDERLDVEQQEDGLTIPGERGLLQLLDIGHTRLCTDLRDKIFSIVGLIEQARAKTPREGGGDLSLLEVDYGKYYEDVLRDATRFCIQESRSLKIWHSSLGHHGLGLKNGRTRLDEVCSWVPMDCFQRRREGNLPHWISPRADADLPIRRETSMATIFDPNVLTLDGYAVMDIVEVSQLLEDHLFQPGARLADTLTSIDRMCRGAKTSDPTRPNGVLGCLACTLVVLPYQGEQYDDKLFLKMQNHIRSVFESGLKNGESNYWSKEAEFSFKVACSRRRVFIGSCGCIGQGPSCLRAGDRIVVLLGGNAPFAVRPLREGDGGSEQRYQLLGPVYVCGAMYGEVVEAAKARGEEPSLFHFK